jgi:hypothetical protein
VSWRLRTLSTLHRATALRVVGNADVASKRLAAMHPDVRGLVKARVARAFTPDDH